MQPDAQGMCHSYYGTWNVNDKPKKGVVVYMIDEHIIRTLERERERLHKELSDVIRNFTKSIESSLRKNDSEIEKIRDVMGDMTKFMYKMVDLNQLKTPELEKVKKKAKPKPKPKKKKEDDYDGYL